MPRIDFSVIENVDMDKMKYCSRCKNFMLKKYFHRNASRKDGFANWCKECMKTYRYDYYKRNPEKFEEYRGYQENYREENYWKLGKLRREKGKETYEKVKEKRKANPEKARAVDREKRRRYHNKNRDKINERARIRYKNNKMAKLNRAMSTGIYLSLKGCKDNHHWEDLVPYTLNDLIKHFKSLFQPGMNWNNMGKGKGCWQIDHVRPVSSFVFSFPNDKEFQECWALSNLCPMWAKDNISKGSKHSYTLPESRRHLYPNPCPYTKNTKPINPKSKEAS